LKSSIEEEGREGAREGGKGDRENGRREDALVF
jgi:hypothetical protein